jgi:hypothetical protein
MKKLFIFSFTLLSMSVLAQNSRSELKTSITDDGKIYAIEIKGDKDGQPIQYSKTFDVKGMTNAEKDGIKQRVLDSLGLGDGDVPKAQVKAKPETVRVTFVCKTCKGNYKLEVRGDDYSSTSEFETKKDESKSLFPQVLDLKEGEYKFIYWQNKVLQMQMKFTVSANSENIITVK